MVRHERVVVRRGGRSRSPSWLPVVLVLGLLVVGGIVLWMFLGGDDGGGAGVAGYFVLGGLGSPALLRRDLETLEEGGELPEAA